MKSERDLSFYAEAKRGDVKRIITRNGIYAAQIRALYQYTPTVLIVNMVNSALVAIMLTSYKRQICWLVVRI